MGITVKHVLKVFLQLKVKNIAISRQAEKQGSKKEKKRKKREGKRKG